MKTYVVNDTRGRITIPERMRNAAGIKPNTLLSLTLQTNGDILIRKEKICDNCRSNDGVPLSEVIMRYPENERDKAFIALSADYARRMEGNRNE